MTLKTTLLSAASAAALLVALAGCASSAPTDTASGSPEPSGTLAPATSIVEGACEGDEGITLQIDSSALAEGTTREWCRTTDETVAVADIVDEAGVVTEGTQEYGDQVVCRVDGLPSATEPVGSTEDPAYVEACASMPAAFAYWSLWTKPAGGEWGYAEEGLATLEAAPGDSVALLFTLDGAPAAPTP